MRINQIIIDPGHGHCDEHGRYDTGIRIDQMFETDLIDKFVQHFSEELEACQMPFRVLPTRKFPGMKPAERASLVEANSFYISVHSGHAKNKSWNYASVSTFEEAHSECVNRLTKILDSWGRLTSPTFRKASYVASAHPALKFKDAICLHLEPFCLDGPDAIKFFLQLERLGKFLARDLVEYSKELKTRKPPPVPSASAPQTHVSDTGQSSLPALT